MTTQNGWNAPYLFTKGDTYAGTGGGARPSVIPVGTDGQVLTADSASTGGVKWVTNASGSGFTSIVVQVFDTPGAATYTASANLSYAVVECVGGGGAGASTSATGASQLSAGGGGGGGEYRRGVYDSVTIGVSQSLVIGSRGIPGTNGGDTTFGSLITAKGGISNGTSGAGDPSLDSGQSGGTGGSGGSFSVDGGGGTPGFGKLFGIGPSFGVALLAGQGGGSYFGGGPRALASNGVSADGVTNNVYGGGGSGALTSYSVGAGNTGGTGGPGAIIVTEFIV